MVSGGSAAGGILGFYLAKKLKKEPLPWVIASSFVGAVVVTSLMD
ncbi:hypothetical protein [Aureibacter tunicatorum]|uniref:RsiW-degrading membrane proteinase PrsW (M82 family) n=1 Tax=Aureibacter tunicatorum TaxID=866807 RepID=A0AAE3XSA3_9BACT|nr:hypothetical protein [Aureibacter tunicatorum]MDR6240976.1 RsiW-degrading membrane proteinase PrsW (M82 family) [Aureibacter tunicatorum]BDD03755.1 hypothetical protein AUTU_12380 [Aureibacter tunicatorum]